MISVVFIEYKKPEEAILWVFVLLVFPLLGMILYAVFGNTLSLKLSYWRKNKEDVYKRQYIQPVLGATNIYISPFGVHFSADDERYRYLVEKGFQIYCPVDSSLRILDRGDNIVMPRVAIDGLALWEKPKFMSTYYFNVEEIRNSLRPEI